jgi:hypothetical protein
MSIRPVLHKAISCKQSATALYDWVHTKDDGDGAQVAAPDLPAPGRRAAHTRGRGNRVRIGWSGNLGVSEHPSFSCVAVEGARGSLASLG